MPLEIRELVIRVSVQEKAPHPAEPDRNSQLLQLKTQVVKECLDKIMDRLEAARER